MRLPIAIAALAAFGFAACGAPKHAARPVEDGAPLPVAVETARDSAWTSGSEVSAGLEPFRRATPGTLLMGRVVRIEKREGDRVAAGDLLAQVDGRDASARQAQAEAGVAAAEAMERNARSMRERMERLYARQAASKKNVDDAVAAHEAAVAGVRAAKEGAGAAKVMVGYADVRSPFAGTVVERKVEAGDIAAPGMPLFVVEDRSKMKVEAQVPESSLAGLSVGGAVEVSIASAGSLVRQGTLAEILPSADPASRTFRVRVILDNADGALRSGMFARLRLPGAPGSRRTVPESAVVRRGPLTGVFVIDTAGIARLRYVSLGETQEGRVEVLTGLEAAERVVTAPPPALEDGRKVEVRG